MSIQVRRDNLRWLDEVEKLNFVGAQGVLIDVQRDAAGDETTVTIGNGGSLAVVTPSGDTTGVLDSAAMNAALAGNTGGCQLVKGTYYVNATLTIDSGQVLAGVGHSATIIQLVAGANVDVLKTAGFAGLTGGNTTGGPYGFFIRDLTIDGGKAGNASGYGIRSYGRDYTIQNVRVRNCANDGIYSEWSTSLAVPGTGDSIEALLNNVKSHDNGGHGIHWNGPHDSLWAHVTTYKNAAIGAWVDANGGGLLAVNCHSWGLSQTYAWRLDQSALLVNCEGEGASIAQVLLAFGNCNIVGGHYFDGGAVAPVGIEIAAGPTSWKVDTKVSSCTSGAIKFTADGGGGSARILANQAAGTVVAGTPATTTQLDVTGPVFVGRGGSLFDIWMDGLGLKAWNFHPQNISTQTAPGTQTVYVIAVPLKAGQIITNVVLDIEIAGVGATPTGFFVGVCDSTGKMLTQSANLNASASLTAQGLRDFAVASYTVQSNGLYYVVVLKDGVFGTTDVSLGRGGGRDLVNGTGKRLSGTAGTGQVALPANAASLAAFSGVGSLNYWAGVR